MNGSSQQFYLNSSAATATTLVLRNTVPPQHRWFGVELGAANFGAGWRPATVIFGASPPRSGVRSLRRVQNLYLCEERRGDLQRCDERCQRSQAKNLYLGTDRGAGIIGRHFGQRHAHCDDAENLTVVSLVDTSQSRLHRREGFTERSLE